MFSFTITTHTCTCTFVHCHIMCRWIISFFSPDFFLLTCDSRKRNYTIWYIVLHNFIFMVGLTCKTYNYITMPYRSDLKSGLLLTWILKAKPTWLIFFISRFFEKKPQPLTNKTFQSTCFTVNVPLFPFA